MVVPRGIEPRSTALQTAAMTTSAKAPYRSTLTFPMSLYTVCIPSMLLYGRTAEIRTRDWQIKSLL